MILGVYLGIFKTYDIRGVYPEELDSNTALRIGRAIGSISKGKSIFLNIDTRKGSKAIKKDFAQGLVQSGARVYDLGMGPIMVSAVASYQNSAYGVCLTASHNPAKYTGIITVRSGVTLEPEEIKKEFDSGKFPNRKGRISNYDYSKRYIDFITKNIENIGLRAGIDSMGGATTFMAKDVAERIGVRPFVLHAGTSETFFGKHPEPKEENGREISKLVINKGLDFGAQFDADGDRVAFYDEKGKFIEPVISGLILMKFNGLKRVLANVSCSRVIEKYAKVKYSKVGHRFMERDLVKGKYDMGIESSSHFYFGKYHPFSDGLLSMALFSKAVLESGEKVSEMVDEFPKLHYVSQSLHFKNDEERSAAMKKIAARMEKFESVDRLDGYKATFEDGFMLFRESGTEPVIRVAYEGDDEKALKRIANLVKKTSK